MVMTKVEMNSMMVRLFPEYLQTINYIEWFSMFFTFLPLKSRWFFSSSWIQLKYWKRRQQFVEAWKIMSLVAQGLLHISLTTFSACQVFRNLTISRFVMSSRESLSLESFSSIKQRISCSVFTLERYLATIDSILYLMFSHRIFSYSNCIPSNSRISINRHPVLTTLKLFMKMLVLFLILTILSILSRRTLAFLGQNFSMNYLIK